MIQANVERVYGLAPRSVFSRSFVRQNQYQQAVLLLETIRFLFRPHTVAITGIEEARKKLQTAAQASGIVIITAHQGAWELAGHCVTLATDRPFHVLAKPSKSRWLTPVLNNVREKLGMKVLWTDSKSILRDMMAVAQRGEHLGFVMDQRPMAKQGGYPSVFLGVKDTPIVSGPVTMIIRKNMPAFGVYLVRVGRAKYHFVCDEIVPPNHQLKEEAVVAQRLADNMSQIIRRYPEQWSWNYRRWKA